MNDSESSIQNKIRGAVNASGVARLFRNNVGETPGTHIKYGLAVGSGDLIGLRNDGRFVSIEVKKPGGRSSPAQLAWIKTITDLGGLAGIAHNVDEAFKIIRGGK